MRFVKMQACGNDYIYIDCLARPDLQRLAEAPSIGWIGEMCRAHFGVGADGIVFITLSNVAYRMVMYNADGSRGKTCGNALRCVAHYLSLAYHAQFPLAIQTDSGLRQVQRVVADAPLYAVDMGTARLVGVGDGTNQEEYYLVDVGNLHAVHRGFVPDITALARRIRAQCANETINVSCYEPCQNCIAMRVCEAGTGITLGCGSGACAIAYAACLFDNYTFGIPIEINMEGGSVRVVCRKDGNLQLIGDAHFVFSGETEAGNG